ncbi:MAG: hypothetical protein WC179_01165 [Candidatus Cloacimonadaceae bacterium]|jgi:hypothetical protein|nr:restriction endonuclease [Candidatus Cloacimonadota bacterium]MCB5258519.1 restriction endonuclease [Candidatus Cloacimonadota bacterium]MDD5624989.1 restriction endonuclease [Candidatus Cloacimonadota bacterium]MDY0112083.1 hypothetical protein [Candidatus Syntrophosphaera sp.]
MNEWIKKSIDLANSPHYLDNLHNIYPISEETWRPIPIETKKTLEAAFSSDDNVALLIELLKLPKFPVNDPYVAFLRKNPKFITYNPATVNRIAQKVRSIGFKAMIEDIEEPKSSSRSMGILFKTWLKKIGYPFFQESEFEKYNGVAFLEGGDKKLKDFANNKLGFKLDKGLDIVAKVKGQYIIGEAKFLTDYGGSQNASFEDAMRLLAAKGGRAIKIAILDGVVWINNKSKMFRKISELNEIALSALLLKEFLESLG